MYFVDRRKLKASLESLDHLLNIYERETWDTEVKRLALERIAQDLVELIIDTGNQMIDGFIMRDPGGYEDVIDILEDESVISAKEAAGIMDIIRQRRMLVQNYMDVDHQKLQNTINEHLAVLKVFSTRVNQYLDRELGPVSAFAPVDRKHDEK